MSLGLKGLRRGGGRGRGGVGRGRTTGSTITTDMKIALEPSFDKFIRSENKPHHKKDLLNLMFFY